MGASQLGFGVEAEAGAPVMVVAVAVVDRLAGAVAVEDRMATERSMTGGVVEVGALEVVPL